MISRVAESCFWLSRHVERIDGLARALEVTQSFGLDVDLRNAERWRPLVIVFGGEDAFSSITPAGLRDDAETVQRFLCLDEANPYSIYSSLYWARENARTIRETVSLEMWLTLNDLWLWFTSRPAKRLYESERSAFYAHLRNQCALFQGHAVGTMLHEEPFEFMRLGTALERVSLTARLLDVKHHALGPETEGPDSADEAAQWLAVLRSCAAMEPFFKRPNNEISSHDIASFLLFDRAFPRSVLHGLHRVRNFLNLIKDEGRPEIGAESRGLVAQLILGVEKSAAAGLDLTTLHAQLTALVDRTNEMGEQIRTDYFLGLTSAQKPAVPRIEPTGVTA